MFHKHGIHVLLAMVWDFVSLYLILFCHYFWCSLCFNIYKMLVLGFVELCALMLGLFLTGASVAELLFFCSARSFLDSLCRSLGHSPENQWRLCRWRITTPGNPGPLRSENYICCYLLVSFIHRRFKFFNEICLIWLS